MELETAGENLASGAPADRAAYAALISPLILFVFVALGRLSSKMPFLSVAAMFFSLHLDPQVDSSHDFICTDFRINGLPLGFFLFCFSSTRDEQPARLQADRELLEAGHFGFDFQSVALLVDLSVNWAQPLSLGLESIVEIPPRHTAVSLENLVGPTGDLFKDRACTLEKVRANGFGVIGCLAS